MEPHTPALPWCQMLSESSHSLHLTRVFTMALLGWIANALADPVVYAFWYPVFRQNLIQMFQRLIRRSSVNFTTENNNRRTSSGGVTTATPGVAVNRGYDNAEVTAT